MISNNYILALCHKTYLRGVANDKPQISQLLSKIGKEQFVGKEMSYASQWDDGGNFGGNHEYIVGHLNENDAAVKNGEWTMGYGFSSGSFDVSQEELQVCKGEPGAYMDVLANKMAGTLSGLNRLVSAQLFGDSLGTLFQIAAADTTSDAITFATGTEVTLTVPADIKFKVGLGTRLVFATAGAANTATPFSPLAGSDVDALAYVSGIEGDKIKIKPLAALNGVTVYTGDYVQLHGFRNAYNSTTGTGFQGLAELLPSYFKRTGSGWTSYIATDFRGRDRSVAVERLAGQYIDGTSYTGNTPKTDALMDLYNATTGYGMGLDNVLIINPKTMIAINKEAVAVNEIRKSVDGKKRVASFGLSDFSIALGEMQSGDVLRDVACPEGKAYSLNAKKDLKFYEINNVGKIISPVANDEIGKVDIESVGTMGISDDPSAHLNLEKLFSITGPVARRNDDVSTVSMNLRGNFKLENISASGVADLA